MSKATTLYLTDTLAQLGNRLTNPDDALLEVINSEYYHNAWFTPLNTLNAVKAIGKMLNESDLALWLENQKAEVGRQGLVVGDQGADLGVQKSGLRNQNIETQSEIEHPASEIQISDLTHPTSAIKKVGLILAGNIPLVGFHDVLCVLASGHHALIKASSNDARLIKYILNMLVSIEPAFAHQYTFIERLTDFDAVIATGSNNTSRYFEYYFGKVPNIIRKNRNSVAMLTGNETNEQMFLLGHDIFDFFGLGCRNVSKLLVPAGYNFVPFFEAIEPHQPIINHHKYNNNYDYNKSIYLVNGDKHLDNGFLLVKEDERMASPLAVLYFEYYNDVAEAQTRLNAMSENIQCLVTTADLATNIPKVAFGQSQQPKLWDYADGADTMAFLASLKQ